MSACPVHSASMSVLPSEVEVLGLVLLDNYSQKLVDEETADHLDSTGDLND
jgi:hypothetical protein